MKSDGSPYTEPYFRTLVVEYTHIGGSNAYTEPYFRTLVVEYTHIGGSNTSWQDRFIIPDDGIVKARIRPEPGDLKIHVRVKGVGLETVCFCF